MENKSNINKAITEKVDETCSYVNSMYYIAMSLKSKKLTKLLNDFENFKETFPRITDDEWGRYSDMKDLPSLLNLHDYNGWLVEIIVPIRKHHKRLIKKSRVKRRKFIYCEQFMEIIPKMLEFAKDVLEDEIIEFNLAKKNENQ